MKGQALWISPPARCPARTRVDRPSALSHLLLAPHPGRAGLGSGSHLGGSGGGAAAGPRSSCGRRSRCTGASSPAGSCPCGSTRAVTGGHRTGRAGSLHRGAAGLWFPGSACVLGMSWEGREGRPKPRRRSVLLGKQGGGREGRGEETPPWGESLWRGCQVKVGGGGLGSLLSCAKVPAGEV